MSPRVTGYTDWPERGVYFFYTDSESRNGVNQTRLTQIGTHAVSAGTGTSLWNRLRSHHGPNGGTYEDGGNHRGSVFQMRAGKAMIERQRLDYPH